MHSDHTLWLHMATDFSQKMVPLQSGCTSRHDCLLHWTQACILLGNNSRLVCSTMETIAQETTRTVFWLDQGPEGSCNNWSFRDLNWSMTRGKHKCASHHCSSTTIVQMLTFATCIPVSDKIGKTIDFDHPADQPAKVTLIIIITLQTQFSSSKRGKRREHFMWNFVSCPRLWFWRDRGADLFIHSILPVHQNSALTILTSESDPWVMEDYMYTGHFVLMLRPLYWSPLK